MWNTAVIKKKKKKVKISLDLRVWVSFPSKKEEASIMVMA